MKLFRKIIFYIFLSIYIVLCPLMIFYALGYIWTPKVEEKFVKTGLINIETLPAGASVQINGNPHTGKTPAIIRDLIEGSYNVRLSLPGYRPVEKRAEIVPGKAINFEKTLLLPLKIPIQKLSDDKFRSIVSIPETRYFLIQKNKYLSGLKIFDTKSKAFRDINFEEKSWQEWTVERVNVSRGSLFFIIEITDGNNKRALGCYIERDKNQIVELNERMLREETRNFWWEGDNPEFVFAGYEHRVLRFAITKKTNLVLDLGDINALGIYKGKIYGVQGDMFVKMNADSKRLNWMEVERGSFFQNIFSSEDILNLDFIASDLLCFMDKKGAFYTNKLPYQIASDDVTGYAPNSSGEKTLLWQKHRFGILDFNKRERKADFFERGTENTWIYSKGKKIRQAFWVLGGNYALFLDSDDIFLIRTEGYSNIEKITRVMADSSIFWDEKSGEVYFLDAIDNKISSMKILPDETFLPAATQTVAEKMGKILEEETK